jgi:heme/copper-type cytochrome/quinol oxidase subunit 2
MITRLFVALILIFVGLYFVATFTPILGNITSPGGIVGTFLEIAIWVIPLLAIVGLIIYGVIHFFPRGR